MLDGLGLRVSRHGRACFYISTAAAKPQMAVQVLWFTVYRFIRGSPDRRRMLVLWPQNVTKSDAADHDRLDVLRWARVENLSSRSGPWIFDSR